MSKWQSIETAPKDGTRVLLYRKDSNDILALEFDDEADFPWGYPESPLGYPSSSFSHWMPLPEPPSTGSADDAG